MSSHPSSSSSILFSIEGIEGIEGSLMQNALYPAQKNCMKREAKKEWHGVVATKTKEVEKLICQPTKAPVRRSTTLHSGNQCSQDTISSTNRKKKAQALSQ
jgi:hypothetical protein